eukprot:2200105-Rhodomonas_salina.1
MQFIPFVGTTLGRLGADAVAMSWGLGLQRRLSWPGVWTLTLSPSTGKYSLQFLQPRSRFEHRNAARLSLALCRAGGSRGVPASAQHYRADADLLEALE